MHNNCSQADIVHYSVNRSHNEQHTLTNCGIQTNRWLTSNHPIACMTHVFVTRTEKELMFSNPSSKIVCEEGR